jgi:hypothetical protein
MKSSLYLKEFNSKEVLQILSILVILYFIRDYLYKGIDRFIISVFAIDQIKQSQDLDSLAVLLTAVAVTYAVWLTFWQKQKPSINAVLKIVLLTGWYILVVRRSPRYYFEPIGFAPMIKYLDVLFLWFLIVTARFKYYSAGGDEASIHGFIEDDFNPEKRPDILGRKKYAGQIAIKILGTPPLQKAFVIAINSPWGFGKSGFLLLTEKFFENRMKPGFLLEAITYYDHVLDTNEIDLLTKRRENVVVVRYNPWKNFDDKKIVQDFFNELSLALRKYDSQLSRHLKSYGKYLTKLDDSRFSKFLEIIIEHSKSDFSLSKLFEEINESIERIKKRILVFIDDLDRLTGDELIDVLRLIRNTANFKNTIFVVAYDHNYVLNTIDKRNLISAKEEYLQKIVQLEITLPIFQKNILIQFLEEQLKEYYTITFGFDRIKTALNEILSIPVVETPKPGASQFEPERIRDFLFRTERTDDSLLFKVFQNLRDVVRFVNSFKLSIEAIGIVADNYEIILLELLRIRYLSIYQMVSNRKLIKIVEQLYEFDFDKFDLAITEKTVKELNLKVDDIPVIRVLLESIFSPTRKIFFRSVKYPRYFDIYFTFQAPNLIQLENVERALSNKDLDEIMKIIDSSARDETFHDLRNFLDSQVDFRSKDDFEIVLKIFFYIAKYDNDQIRHSTANQEYTKK